MDFDKLKKAAKETIKIMSAKEEELPQDDTEVSADNEPADDEAADDLFGSTQRLDFKTILERFRNKAYAPVPSTEEKPAQKKENNSPEPDQIPIPAEAMDELAKTVDEIDKRTEEITIAADENNEKLSASLVILKSEFDTSISDVKQELAEIRKLIEAAGEQAGDSFHSVTTRLNNAEKKTEKLANSLSGVAKLNDSIFDLKNSQMNTRNTLGDLEASFYSLKRKMTTGVLLISIIAAVIAVLEIINLLS